MVGLYGHTEMYSSVELCITGNLSLGSVGLHSSVQLCIAKGWFADDVSHDYSSLMLTVCHCQIFAHPRHQVVFEATFD